MNPKPGGRLPGQARQPRRRFDPELIRADVSPSGPQLAHPNESRLSLPPNRSAT